MLLIPIILGVVFCLIVNLTIGFHMWGGWNGAFLFLLAIPIMVLFNIIIIVMLVRLRTITKETFFILVIFILSQTIYALAGFQGLGDGVVSPGTPGFTQWGAGLEDGRFGLNSYFKMNLPNVFFDVALLVAIVLFFGMFIRFTVHMRQLRKSQAV